MLSIEHITKRYGAFTALEDISLNLTPGIYGLLAPNGAGKTTLIKMLTTLSFPTKGKILWKGKEIIALQEKYRGILGYMPQQFGYYPDYTPRQFLMYMAVLQQIPHNKAKTRINKMLEMVGLSDVADKKMKKLSGGMIQRVGIAQAMLHNPRILILDEPTAGLDPKERVRFRNLIHTLATDRIVILSTHIVSDVETIADQVIMLRDHQIYVCDSPAAICSRLNGRVFEVPSGTTLQPGQIMLSERSGENGPVLRIISKTPPAEGKAVLPGLEDAFLHIYREEAL